ncbi:MAG: sugar ABC transporter ATP-binding protein [Bauldia sp.]|nr:sugar ABC transporter ATP-binding protein [Bauldia sp.]
MTETENVASPVSLRHVSKYFPGVVALRDVSIDFLPGEVHGLVGENGAGKSTLIKIITGAYRPDEGSVSLFGKDVADADPRTRQRAGVGVIYQERAIVPELSAAGNVFLGQSIRWGPFISARATTRRFRELAERVGADVNPKAVAGTLSVANQQLLEIMRALQAEHRILILDEPTTALGTPERKRLFSVVDELRQAGLALVFISHDLDEVLDLCDRVTVMRDGQKVATAKSGDWTKQSLVDAMLGGVELRQVADRKPPDAGPAMSVKQLRIPGVIDEVSFTVKRGEILGIAGLIGSGRTEILRAIAGADGRADGEIEIKGRGQPWPTSVSRALAYGIALAPEDRRRQGLVLGMSAAHNVTLTDLGAAVNGLVLSDKRRSRLARETMGDLAFNLARLPMPAETLSGGNQQKLVIGKWLFRKPDVLLLDEPTQGIDVGAKAEIFGVMAELANRGMAIVFVSSEFEEVVDISDRILVIGRGRHLATLGREEASTKRILDLLFEVEAAA